MYIGGRLRISAPGTVGTQISAAGGKESGPGANVSLSFDKVNYSREFQGFAGSLWTLPTGTDHARESESAAVDRIVDNESGRMTRLEG